MAPEGLGEMVAHVWVEFETQGTQITGDLATHSGRACSNSFDWYIYGEQCVSQD